MHASTVDTELLEQARTFRDRATSLRLHSEGLDRFLASTYRRRASELELEAFVAELQAGIPYDEVHSPAA